MGARGHPAGAPNVVDAFNADDRCTSSKLTQDTDDNDMRPA